MAVAFVFMVDAAHLIYLDGLTYPLLSKSNFVYHLKLTHVLYLLPKVGVCLFINCTVFVCTADVLLLLAPFVI